LADLIRSDKELELTAPVVSNVICFRFKPFGTKKEDLEFLFGEIKKLGKKPAICSSTR